MSTALKNKKIRITPISRIGGWLKPGHDGHFMYTGTNKEYCVPMDANTGKLVDPLEGLTEEELDDLAKKMATTKEEFNIYSKNSYWNGYGVKLNKDEKILDLSKPKDFLDYKLLLSNKDFISPSFAERFDKGTYSFALSDMDEEIVEKRKSSDKKKEAYKALGKMENSDTRLRNFFKVYGKRVSADASKDWMVGEIDTIIENDINRFLEIVEDINYDSKIEIAEAVDARALVLKANNTYELPGGENIGSIDKAIEYLKEPKNSDTLMIIRSRINSSK